MAPPSSRTLGRWLAPAPIVLAPAPHGHTNESFFVAAGDARFVLRRSWPGKPAAQLAQEAAILEALGDLPVPRLVPTLAGEPHLVEDGRVLQLFRRCPGEPGPRWLGARRPLDGAARERGADDRARIERAAARLGELHRALARLPGGRGDPLHWLRARLARVAAGGRWRLPPDAADVLAAVARLLAPRAPVDLQWLHGDYHLGNLLWQDGQVTGIVDFDDCERGTAAGEAALALFALSRRDDGEARFAFDRALFGCGAVAYERAGGPLGDFADAATMEPIFCAYQVLIHAEAMQRGLWSPAPGIGFWPAWNRFSAPLRGR